MRHWMPDVHLMWSEGVAHLLNESCRLGSILKPVCGPRVHGSRHDGDPSIKKMPTSKKITNVVICHSSSTVPQKKKMVLSPWMPRRQHGCDFSDSKCLLVDPEVCAGSHHGQRRTTYEGVRYAIVNATSLEERFRSSSWVTAVMKTGQIGDGEKFGPLSRKSTTVVAKSHNSERSSCLEKSAWPPSKIRALLPAPMHWTRA